MNSKTAKSTRPAIRAMVPDDLQRVVEKIGRGKGLGFVAGELAVPLFEIQSADELARGPLAAGELAES